MRRRYAASVGVNTKTDRQDAQHILSLLLKDDFPPSLPAYGNVIIDRKGLIRAVSGGAGGDPRLEDEASLRALIERLLSERTEAVSRPTK
jgi:hypothetical protein